MPGSVQSVERAAAMLRLLARRSTALPIGEIAKSLGLPKATAHGIARTLVQVGFVEQDGESGGYRVGRSLLDLGAGYVDVNELRSRSMNWADALAARSGEAVHIATPAEGGVLVVHHVFRPDDTAQVLEIGTVLPAHATALGKVLLAHDDALAASVRDAGHTMFTRGTLSPAELKHALAAVRDEGIATEVGEFRPASAGIAAPVRTAGGLVVGAVGVSGAIQRLCDARSRPREAPVAQVRDTATAITRALCEPT